MAALTRARMRLAHASSCAPAPLHDLRRAAHIIACCQVLGLFGLTCMSTAAIIGSGIFVLTGVVAKNYAG